MLMHISKQHLPPRRRCKAEKRAVRRPIPGQAPCLEHLVNNVKSGDFGRERRAPFGVERAASYGRSGAMNALPHIAPDPRRLGARSPALLSRRIPARAFSTTA